MPSAPASRRAPRGTKPRPRAAKAGERAGAARILDILHQTYPDATCELRYRNPYELVTATILSAQCTDERVNQVTPELFRRYPDARALAAARPAELEEVIRPTGFYRAKAKSLIGCARGLAEGHGGEVPRTLAEMVKLPGVGRKTANVVLGHVYGVNEGIAVDTHVLRVAARLGLTRGDDPKDVEQQLMALVPRERWTLVTDLLIFHGRRACQARRPQCGSCPAFSLCRFEHKQAYAMNEPPKRRREAARA